MKLHQTKKFCVAKAIINKTKRQSIEWEKILSNDISKKGLISKMCKDNSIPKNKQSNLKMGTGTE